MIDKRNSNKPDWIRVRSAGFNTGNISVTNIICKTNKMHTVCEEARCPNIGECWGSRTATFLAMGDTCTRRCAFCSIKSGVPSRLDGNEPGRIADSINEMGVKYAVITSVTRDDLQDGGAQHFAEIIRAIRRNCDGVRIEILTPDFHYDNKNIDIVLSEKPDVFAHNLEVVRRFHDTVKKKPADYDKSLSMLKYIKQNGCITKSAIIVGFGEDDDEVFESIEEFADIDLDILTIGQYLRPTEDQIPIHRFVTPAQFEKYKIIGEKIGIKYVVSGPMVRSSYKAYDGWKAVAGA